jgi:hypothetical protein
MAKKEIGHLTFAEFYHTKIKATKEMVGLMKYPNEQISDDALYVWVYYHGFVIEVRPGFEYWVEDYRGYHKFQSLDKAEAFLWEEFENDINPPPKYEMNRELFDLLAKYQQSLIDLNNYLTDNMTDEMNEAIAKFYPEYMPSIGDHRNDIVGWLENTFMVYVKSDKK